MKQTEIDYLDGEFQVTEEEPSTLDEVVALIGEVGVVDETTSNLRYRNKYPRVYKAASKAVVDSGYPKKVKETKTMKDGTVKNVHESDNDHLRAFLSGRKDKDGTVTEQPSPGAREVLQTVFTKIATVEPLYVKGERTGGGGKVSQGALDAANNFFAAGDEKVEAVVSKIEEIITGYKVGRDADGEATPESLARGIQALGKWQQKQAEKAAVAALAAA